MHHSVSTLSTAPPGPTWTSGFLLHDSEVSARLNHCIVITCQLKNPYLQHWKSPICILNSDIFFFSEPLHCNYLPTEKPLLAALKVCHLHFKQWHFFQWNIWQYVTTTITTTTTNLPDSLAWHIQLWTYFQGQGLIQRERASLTGHPTTS